MSFLDGAPLSELPKDPSKKGRQVLNPQISDRSLKRAYREMAALVLELSKLEFDSIGALAENERGFSIAKRPVTYNMNELMVSAHSPEEVLPSNTFRSATDYFKALAMQHLFHLRLQQRDAVSGGNSLLVVYFLISRRNSGPSLLKSRFQLFCDDFRPSNVLMDLDAHRGSRVIDWEFTYAAPAEFTYVAPWWLLLQSPEDWEGDLNEFLMMRYIPRLRAFLGVLNDYEDKLIKQHLLSGSQRLSPRKEHSLETGLFWVCLGARYSSMFDEIYSSVLRNLYFSRGPNKAFGA